MSRVPLAQSAALLWPALAAGAVLGAWVPFELAWLNAAGKAYLAVLNMVALPLIVLAVWSGLRQACSQPGSVARLASLAALGLAAMVLFAGWGAALAMLTASGPALGEGEAAILGRLALDVEPPVRVAALAPEALPEGLRWDWIVPDNGYRALAYATLGSALLGVLFFGAGLAAQGTERSRAFQALSQGIYRSLETLVERVNTLLPLFVFALAAGAMNTLGLEALERMQGFLAPLALAAASMVGLAVAVVSLRLGLPFLRVSGALQVPMLVALFSNSPAAAVPGLIDALCNQLGLRRDLTELVAPLVPVFLRLGDAVFFGVLAVFVAGLYGKPLTGLDLAWIAAASATAAMASLALASGWSLAAGGALLAGLGLPFEALLPTFVLLEVLTAGIRTLLSVVLVAPLLALVAPDRLPRGAGPAHTLLNSPSPRLGFTVRRGQAFALGGLIAMALLTACLAGVGVGLREAAAPAAVSASPQRLDAPRSTP